MAHAERFLVDEEGKRVAVVLDAAKDIAVPLDDALQEIARRRG
jgi:hypothetical protein